MCCQSVEQPAYLLTTLVAQILLRLALCKSFTYLPYLLTNFGSLNSLKKYLDEIDLSKFIDKY